MNNLIQKILNILSKIIFGLTVFNVALLVATILKFHYFLLGLMAPSEHFFVSRTYQQIEDYMISFLWIISFITLLSVIISIIIFIIKRKKETLNINKKLLIISFVLVLSIISFITIITLGSVTGWTRNMDRKSEIRAIITAQELHYHDNGVYFTHTNLDNGTPVIDKYLQSLDDILASNQHYKWLNNSSANVQDCIDGEHFCAYATLEGKPIKYYAASERGTKEVDFIPGSIGGIYGIDHCNCF